jgi:hypothetical protein
MSTSTKDMSNTFSQSSSTQEEQYLALQAIRHDDDDNSTPSLDKQVW